MTFNSPVPKKRARIEIIPLIDIMFFLLASFMMVSLSQVHMKGIRVNLPAIVAPTQPLPTPDPKDRLSLFVPSSIISNAAIPAATATGSSGTIAPNERAVSRRRRLMTRNPRANWSRALPEWR